MDCLPNISLRMLFPTWIQSLLFSRSDDDSFWGGEDEQGHSGRKIPDIGVSYTQAEIAVYDPTSHPVCDLDNSRKPTVEIDRGTSQASLQNSPVQSISPGRTAEYTYRRETSTSSNNTDSDILELPLIPPSIPICTRGMIVSLGASRSKNPVSNTPPLVTPLMCHVGTAKNSKVL